LAQFNRGKHITKQAKSVATPNILDAKSFFAYYSEQ
jgi:hypothetical protein